MLENTINNYRIVCEKLRTLVMTRAHTDVVLLIYMHDPQWRVRGL